MAAVMTVSVGVDLTGVATHHHDGGAAAVAVAAGVAMTAVVDVADHHHVDMTTTGVAVAAEWEVGAPRPEEHLGAPLVAHRVAMCALVHVPTRGVTAPLKN